VVRRITSLNKVSIVIPFHNEEKNVERVISRVHSFLERNKIKGEIVAVDDRSTDSTGKILDELEKSYRKLKVIHRKGGLGVEFGYAVRDGIKASSGDVIVVMMGDLSDDPKDVKKMLKKIEEGYDVVCGSRFIEGGKAIGYPFLKLIAHRIYNKFFSFIFGLGLKDFSNGFKAYKRKIFEFIRVESKGFEFNAEVVLKAHMLDFKITEVLVGK